MGDMLDDIIGISKELSGMRDDLVGAGRGSAGKDAARTSVREPWDPTAFCDRPTIAYDLCLRHRDPNAACNECEAVCPARALAFDGGDVVIDQRTCQGCLLCSAVCPTGALAGSRFSPRALYDAVCDRADATEVAYLTCTRVERTSTPPEQVTVLPCLAAVSTEVWTAALLDHPNLAVWLPLDACGTCPWRAGEQLYLDAIATAEKHTGEHVGLECDERDLKMGPNRANERRDFVRNAAKAAGGAALAANPVGRRAKRVTDALGVDPLTALAPKLGGFIAGDKGPAQHVEGNRAVLLAAIDAHRDRAARIRVTVSATDAKTCTGCRACVDACPVGARRIENGVAKVERKLCLDCAFCAEVCPHEAVRRVRINGRTLIGLSAKPQKVDVAKVASDLVPSQVKKAIKGKGSPS